MFKTLPSEYLEEDSYTISYYFDTEFWVSFHDYIGNFRFSTRNQKMYSFFDNKIWLHNQNNYSIFYDKLPKISYISPVFKLAQSFILNSLQMIVSFFKTNDNFEKRLMNKTFTSVSLHNSYQSTREIPLIISDDSCKTISDRDYNTKRINSSWFFNKIKDETDISLVKTIVEEFDEIVKNTIRIDCQKKKRIFVDNFVIVKLNYNNKEQLFMQFSEVDIQVQPLKI